jgi:Flp pilus assembly protein TadD
MLSNKTLLHLALIILLGLLAYSNTFNVPFQFDDKVYIENNILFTSPGEICSPLSTASSLPEGNIKIIVFTRYLGHLSFAINYWLGGFEPMGYHATNLAIHIINALLVYWLVVLTFGMPFMKGSRLTDYAGYIALFSGLLFVSHPVQTEAVTYITQRFTSLCAMFYFLSLTLYIKARLAEGKKSHAFYWLSFISALMAMFTKEIAFTLPVAIALYEFMFFGSGLKGSVKRLLPYLLLMPIIPFLVLSNSEMNPGRPLVDIIARAITAQLEITSWEYFLTQLRIMPTYLRLTVLPINQNLDYDYPVYNTFLNANVLLSFVFLAGIAGLGAVLVRRSARTEPVLRLVSFGIFWFFITLSVESSFIVLDDLIFEHRLYLPNAGIIVAAVTAVTHLIEKSSGRKTLAAAMVCAALLPVLLGSATYARNSVWESNKSIWEDVVRKAPDKWRGHNNLGNQYQEAGLLEKAIGQYKEAIRLDPENASSYYNLGNSYKRLGLDDLALEQYLLALKREPNQVKVYNNMGNIYLGRGLYDKAIEQYSQAIRRKPDYAEAHYNIGIAHYYKGTLDKAVEHYVAALEISPNDPEFHYNLGVVYIDLGKTDLARREFETTLRLDPGFNEARVLLEKISYPSGAEPGGER